MFEKTPVRSTAQEILTQGNKCSKIGDGVGGKVMKLGSKEIQESPEKGMWRQGETAVDMSREEDALTLLRLRLGLVPRQSPGLVGNQAPFD
jgi:hypothetical protein